MAKKSVIYRALIISYLCCQCIVGFFAVFIKFSLIILCVFTVIVEQNVPDKESELLFYLEFYFS